MCPLDAKIPCGGLISRPWTTHLFSRPTKIWQPVFKDGDSSNMRTRCYCTRAKSRAITVEQKRHMDTVESTYRSPVV
jgi:hypothetical protein